jgi:pimeloyl-ACP methyl ester carboxylesterase
MAMYPDRVLSAAPCAAGWIQSTPDNEATSEELIKSLEAGKGLEPLNRRLRPGGKKLNPIVEKIVNLFVSILNDQRALANVVRGMREYTVTEAELRANRVPVLSIVGSRDPIGKTAKAMEGILGNYTLLVIQGADHMTTIRRPEFLAALRPFLAEHSPQAT